MIGVPSKRDVLTARRILDGIRNGSGKAKAVFAVSMSYGTFLGWIKDDAKFGEQVIAAESERDQKLKEACLDGIQKAGAASWQAYAWILERKFKEEFALNVRTTADVTLKLDM